MELVFVLVVGVAIGAKLGYWRGEADRRWYCDRYVDEMRTAYILRRYLEEPDEWNALPTSEQARLLA